MASNTKLTIGPYKCGKTTHVLTELIRFKKENPLTNSLVIVPSYRSYRSLLEHLKRVLISESAANESDQLKGLFNLQILPFYQACQSVLNSQNIKYESLPKELRQEIVRKVLLEQKNRNQLKHLHNIASLPGTSAAVTELIDEFERSGLTPEDVLNSLEKTHSQQSRQFELANIYQEYWAYLDKTGHVDQKQLAFLAREALFTNANDRKKFGILLIDGFDRISPLQAQVMQGLAKLANKTLVAFDYILPDHAISNSYLKQEDYIWKADSYKQLVDSLSPEVEIIAGGEINQLAPVESFSSIDCFLEMQEIARQCKLAIVEKQIKPNQILVVTRNLGEYRAAVETSFAQAELDFIIDESNNLSTLPLAKFLKSLLRLPINNFLRTDVIDCLSSPYFKKSCLNFSNADVTALNLLSLNSHLLSSKENWLKLPMPEMMKEKLKEFLDEISSTKINTSINKHCQITENIIDKYLLLPERNIDSSSLAAQQESEVLKTIRSILNILLTEENVLSSIDLTREEFLSKFENRLDASTSANPVISQDAIIISGADTAPDRLFAEIYIAGLVEGDFPRRLKSSGFISKDELAAWQNLGINITNPRLAPEFEHALFNSIIQRARNKICYSFPKYRMTGEELTPSFFIQEIFNADPKTIPLLYPHQTSHSQPTSASQAIASWLWTNGYESIPNLWHSHPKLGEYWESIAEPLRSSITRLKSNPLNVFNGYLNDFVQTGALKVNPPEIWSATSINTYKQCPFKFWMTYMLGIEPMEEAEFGLSPKLKGQIHHKVLELYYSKVSALEKEGEKVSSPHEKIFIESFEESVNWLSKMPEFHAGPYWENEKKEVYFRLYRFIENEHGRWQNSQMQTAMFEVGFGDKNSFYPAFVVSGPEKPIKIKGKIDRIDISPLESQARIIDYKLGSERISSSDAFQGHNIQIPIYALAVEQIISPGTAVVEGNYLSTNVASPIGNIDFKKYPDLKESTLRHITSTVAAVNAGDFRIAPSKSKICNYCQHINICRISELKANTFEEEEIVEFD